MTNSPDNIASILFAGSPLLITEIAGGVYLLRAARLARRARWAGGVLIGIAFLQVSFVVAEQLNRYLQLQPGIKGMFVLMILIGCCNTAAIAYIIRAIMRPMGQEANNVVIDPAG